jgi:hypothetical protein
MSHIREAVLRANPAYELILFDRLNDVERKVFAELENDSDLYGLLRPRTSSLGVHAICRETALLFLTLQEPSRLPRYVSTVFGAETEKSTIRLVLDGILEVETEQGFVSGAAAHHLFDFPDNSVDGEENDKVGQLSLHALRYGQALDIDDKRTLSARLYFYGRQPLSAAWRRRLPSPEKVLDYLGLRGTGSVNRILERDWLASSPRDFNGWFSWRAKGATPLRADRSAGVHKLYVSPQPEQARPALEATVAVASRRHVVQFKVGGNAAGVLRPDKIVIYLSSFNHLSEVADALAMALEGCPAQGVPFTAEIVPGGLLAWGIDPPGDSPYARWEGAESWRLQITNRLASALVTAKAGILDAEPWRFALRRLRMEGVDPTTWTPIPSETVNSGE